MCPSLTEAFAGSPEQLGEATSLKEGLGFRVEETYAGWSETIHVLQIHVLDALRSQASRKGQAVAVVLDFGLWVRRLGLNGYKGSGLRVTGTASH